MERYSVREQRLRKENDVARQHELDGYGVKQFFQDGGSECWVVRVASDGTGGTTAEATSEKTINATAGGGGDDMFRVRAGRQFRGESAVNPGS